MAIAERTVGYVFHRVYYADIENRRVLCNGKPLTIPLTQKEFDVLEFFLMNPKRLILRDAVTPLDQTAGRPPADNYVSKIVAKLGTDCEGLFKPTRGKGYTLDTNVRPILASDQQEGGDIFKASEIHFNTHTVESMRASLRQSLRALEVNPHGIPEAHVTIAYDYINLSQAAYGAELPHKVMPEARRHAEAALKEDSSSSRALGVLGLISMIYDYDWEAAKRQLEDALKLNPDDSATLLSFGHFLVGVGEPESGVAAVEKAVRIDPTDMIIHASAGWMHLLNGDVEGAISLGKKTTFLYPDLPAGYVILGWAYEKAGQYADAERHYQKSLDIEYSPAALSSLGHLKSKLGDRAGGLRVLKELYELHERGAISYVPSYCRALIFAGLQDTQECLRALEDAYEQHCDWLIHLAVESRWDPVRQTARFKALEQRVGVSPARQCPQPQSSA